MRKAGVLLPITALMGEYGIGDFGRGADTFLGFIRAMGFSVWQVLPITTIGLGNSPYSGYSAFAGEYTLIDLDSLPQRLLTDDEKNSGKYGGGAYRVDYNFAKQTKKRLLKIAYDRLNDEDIAQIKAFRQENSYWLDDYALYSAIKVDCRDISFLDWEDGLKFRKKDAIDQAKDRLKYQIEYYYFEQYLFFKQWKRLKQKANDLGIEIFGDIPIYVAGDSADVWSNPKMFVLDKDLRPLSVAGVPPDYFAKDGQLWGNPIYDYKAMSKNDYEWWVKRIEFNLSLYDILRIDHFRGLWEYYTIDAKQTTAKNGKWQKGPQMHIWNSLKERIANPNIVAEDLGLIDEGVKKYLECTGFAGMRVFQFAFDGDKQNVHLPYNYPINTVAYTATHDNSTTLGWLYDLPSEVRDEVLSYINVNEGWGMGGGNAPAVMAIIKEVIASSAKMAIIPMQNLCGYGNDTRTNIPGVPNGNWEFRTTYSALDCVNQAYMLMLNRKYGRTRL